MYPYICTPSIRLLSRNLRCLYRLHICDVQAAAHLMQNLWRPKNREIIHIINYKSRTLSWLDSLHPARQHALGIQTIGAGFRASGFQVRSSGVPFFFAACMACTALKLGTLLELRQSSSRRGHGNLPVENQFGLQGLRAGQLWVDMLRKAHRPTAQLIAEPILWHSRAIAYMFCYRAEAQGSIVIVHAVLGI